MKPEFARRRQNRTAFLLRLYEEVDASVSTFVNAYEVAAPLDLTHEEITRTIDYFAEKGYVRVDDHKLGIIRITASGIDYVETLSG